MYVIMNWSLLNKVFREKKIHGHVPVVELCSLQTARSFSDNRTMTRVKLRAVKRGASPYTESKALSDRKRCQLKNQLQTRQRCLCFISY